MLNSKFLDLSPIFQLFLLCINQYQIFSQFLLVVSQTIWIISGEIKAFFFFGMYFLIHKLFN